MTYVVRVRPSVAEQVARFPAHLADYWPVCLELISQDTRPRIDTWVERRIPIRGIPSRTHIYEIREEKSVSGEVMFAFAAEFFAEYFILYSVMESQRVIDVFYLRLSP